MNRLILLCVFTVLFVFFGCASVQRNVDYYKQCMGDPDCVAQVKLVHNVTEATVAPFVSQGNYLVEAVGMLASLLAGMIYGRKTRKV